MFFLLYKRPCKRPDDAVFDDFPKISEDFPKLFRRQVNVSGHFSNISEDYRRLPKTTEEDPKKFRSYTNKF